MRRSEQDVMAEERRFFVKVYAWMFLGLGISGVTAYFVASSPALTGLFIGNPFVFISLVICQLALVFSLIWLVKRISASLAVWLFLFYCFTTGLTLSVIFLVYALASIGLTFFITAGMFGFMSVYGYFTKADLTSIGQVLFMGLIGIILASIVNIFLQSSTADFVISIFGVIIFTGLTAYDTQKIRKLNIIGNEGTSEDTKEGIMGALNLYLDFINLFLSLLRLLGKRK